MADRMDCEGTLKVTLALAAAPDISSNPTDIVLILDRSGSMSGTQLENLKTGAKTFIGIIDESTDGIKDGQIGGGSHIGIVSFASTAAANTQLITSVADLDAAVDSLTAGGTTNHADAFAKATELFEPMSPNAKVMVMFTDGRTTAGIPPAPVAEAAKAAGITIYCIGLIGSDGIDVQTLNDWASEPDTSHVAITPNDDELEQIFADLAANISKPGATNIIIDEKISPDFAITNVIPPDTGTAMTLSSNELQWKIPQLGVTGNEGASLEFYIKHIAQTGGTKPVNESITYSDDENNSVSFPDPTVIVSCGTVITPEPCPDPVELSVDGCHDTISVNLGDVTLESLGRIVELNVTLKSICPEKRVALGVILTETDNNGKEYPRGMKAITVPAHYAPACRDILVKCIKFVLPEDLNPETGSPHSMCTPRKLKARFIAHYVDTDFCCCETICSVQ